MESKRDDLVEAAKSLLWEVGYESMSPKKVLAKSGAGQGSLYHHFEGKKDLAAAALAEVETEMRADCDRIFAQDKPAMTRLSDYLNLKRNGLKGCRLGRLANEATLGQEDLRRPLAQYFDHVEKVVARAISEAASNGELPEDVRPKEIAAALVAAIQGGYILSRVHNNSKHIRLATNGAAAMLEALKIQ